MNSTILNEFATLPITEVGPASLFRRIPENFAPSSRSSSSKPDTTPLPNICLDNDSILRAAKHQLQTISTVSLPSSPTVLLSWRTPGQRRYLHRQSIALGRGVTTQQRRFFHWGRGNIGRLEDAADANPTDARIQAAFYRAALTEDPEIVVRRFEDERYGRDEECASLYLAALYETNQLKRATSYLLHPSSSPTANGDVNSTTNGLPIFNFGTKERPIYVHNTTGAGSGGFGGGVLRKLWTALNVAVLGTLAYSLFSMSETRFGGVGITGKAHRLFKKGETAEHVYTFSDVQGCDEAKHELEEIVEFLKNPEKFNKLGARMPKGVLLVGPPGTGKTLLAKAVAGEADVPFIYASGSQFDEVFVGVGSMRIRQMFEAAKAQAPAIIFIDEIDALGSRRNPRDPQHSRMSLNQLLTEMDGFSETTGVIVIAATNLPESLDKALLRPGRFDRHVHVPLPDIRGRRQILDMYLRDCRLATDVDTSLMARATPGFSGAELFKMVNTAKISASVENGTELSMAHLERAKDEMLMGAARKSAILADEDRRVTAYHEGGHAIVALHTRHANPIHKATIMPRGMALGMVTQLPERDELSISRAQLLARMDVAMGGRVAEALVFGEDQITTGASNDFAQATAIARAMVTQYGMSERIGPLAINESDWETLSPETRSLIDNEVKRLLDESHARAKTLLVLYRKKLDQLATALLDYETLSREEIETILMGKPNSGSKAWTEKHKYPHNHQTGKAPSPDEQVKLDLLY